MKNPFLLPVEHYNRDLNIIDGYLNDNALYLSLMTGDSMPECLEFVKSQVRPDGPTPLKNPRALILNKNDKGDREARGGSFMGFLNRVEKEKLLLSPSMAVYMPEDRRQSTHAIYIEEGVKRRKVAKTAMLDAERAQNKEVALFKKGEQNNLKINNNSYSGATVSTATILHYKSTHSSLTSTCRTATSYANASNEKFIMGNRHYYSPEITKANILSIINNSDLAAIDTMCQQFGLHYPTPEEVIDVIRYSTANYWSGETHFNTFLTMATNMTPVQRAAVVYVGDLYHLYQYNRDFVKTFLFELAELGNPSVVVSKEEYESYDDDVALLANFLCFDLAKGRNNKELIKDDPAVWNQIKSTARHAIEVLVKYKPMLEALFMTTNVPSSIHAFPSVYRRAAVVSDTDSTMFTLQYWVEQLFGKVIFTEEAKRVVFAMVFLVCELVMHVLAIQSANMGVSKKKLRLLAMKNEYYFAVMSLTTASKHYYASQDAQEGIMFLKAKMEVKGVGLRDSKVPQKINKTAKAMMSEIIETIKNGEKLDMHDLLTRVANLEREIVESVNNGKFEYLTTGQIKGKESYKNENNANYKQFELWRDVFAPSFGVTKEPPYSVVKMSLAVNNKTDIDRWCEQMKNPELAKRLKDWMLEQRKTDLGTMMIPMSVVESTGIPREITCMIDTRRIISNTMRTFYLMLESLGIFLAEKNNIRLISDYY
jgi:hypothetical protein